MLTVAEALKAIQDRTCSLPPRSEPLGRALGCLLAEEVAADSDSPPFDKSLVDGYAVRSADLAGSAGRLRLGEEVPAGRVASRPLAPGEAAAIMTGAPLPPGADAVVMVEQTQREADWVLFVTVPEILPGRGVLPRGREMRAGEVLLRPGDRLTPARLGLLASVGRTEVQVIPRPRVVLLPTGDELVPPDRVPGPGQIRNSNSTTLAALAAACDVPVESHPIAPDDPAGLREALAVGLDADVLMITGGVSAGTRDLVPGTLEALGVTRVFHKVKVRPGAPLWFGVGPERASGPGALVFGLPGNPVSGIVGFLLFVAPALAALAGRPPVGPCLLQGRLAVPFAHRGPRATYHPARWIDQPEGAPPLVEPLAWAGSADLRTVALADGFASFPPGDRSHAAGEPIGFLPMPG